MEPRRQIREARMIERAIRGNWLGARAYPTRVLKRDLIDHVQEQGDFDHVERLMLANFELLEGDPRAKGIAVRNGIAMENANLALENPGKQAETNVNVNVQVDLVQQTVNAMCAELLHDPEYLDYLRDRASESPGPSESGAICRDGQSGPMEDGSSLEGLGSCTDGSGDGHA